MLDPHSNPKAKARAVFVAAVERGVPADNIIDAAAKFAERCVEQAKAGDLEPRFVPMAVSWLNQERWADDQGGPNVFAQADEDDRDTIH